MRFEFIEKLGSGAFGDVYKGRDLTLNRNVAIKFFRGPGDSVSNAMDHARALARNNHPNVVKIYSMEKAVDPSTREEIDCVVMELIEGQTLENRLEGPKFEPGELKALGLQLIDGLEYIHNQGLVHGDFHANNVMVDEQEIKIIDLLYRGTLAGLPTANRENRVQQDLRALRLILVHLFAHSELDPSEADAFNQRLLGVATITSIKEAFSYFTDPEITGNLDRIIDHAYRRMIDDYFVGGSEYASALSEETPRHVLLPLLKKVIRERAYDPKHSYYLKALWSRLSEGEVQGRVRSPLHRVALRAYPNAELQLASHIDRYVIGGGPWMTSLGSAA